MAYQTSGASETIFVNFFSRSSRATGPNTRVPTGSPASLISTAALSSNRMYVPSLRRRSRSEEHTSELQSLTNLVCRLLLEKKKKDLHIEERHRVFAVATRQAAVDFQAQRHIRVNGNANESAATLMNDDVYPPHAAMLTKRD